MAGSIGGTSFTTDGLAFLFDVGNYLCYNNVNPSNNVFDIIGGASGTKTSNVIFNSSRSSFFNIPEGSNRIEFPTTSMDFNNSWSWSGVMAPSFGSFFPPIISSIKNTSDQSDNGNICLQTVGTSSPNLDYRLLRGSSATNLDTSQQTPGKFVAFTLARNMIAPFSNVRLYINNESAAIASLSTLSPSFVSNITIGDIDGIYNPGRELDFSILIGYNKELSQDEIAHNHNILIKRYNIAT